MLTIIPWNEFIALTKNVKEDDGNKVPFKWSDLLKHHSKNITDIDEYISTTDCKFIANGSARRAYFLPPGAYDKEKLDEPSCFKVAKSEGKGIAQNKAEVETLVNFADNSKQCFPKLYDWEEKNYLFLLCEVGTPLSDSPNSVINKYIADIGNYLEKMKNDGNVPDFYYAKDFSNIYNMEDLFYWIEDMLDWDQLVKFDKEKMERGREILDEIDRDLPQYRGITDMIRVILETGDKVVDAIDFTASANWAFVNRKGTLMMIPIDWGFTKEVRDKYY